MKGGARARSGPAPDPNALRRDRDHNEWTYLPAAGRAGEPPDWPLTRQTKRETALWAREWARPQALMWEANGQQSEVAVYVRSFAVAERPGASVAIRTLLRQQMDALGLTIPGLRMSRWIIAVDEEPRPQAAREVDAASARDRLRLVVGE